MTLKHHTGEIKRRNKDAITHVINLMTHHLGHVSSSLFGPQCVVGVKDLLLLGCGEASDVTVDGGRWG